jgi:hypothetical protein
MIDQISSRCHNRETTIYVNNVLKQLLGFSIHKAFQQKATTKKLQLEKDDMFTEYLIYALNLH